MSARDPNIVRSIQENTKRMLGYSSTDKDDYTRGAEAMRQRCVDHLRQRAEEEARRSRMITSAACSRLAQEVESMNVVVPERAEDW